MCYGNTEKGGIRTSLGEGVSWVKLCPLNGYVEVLTPLVPGNVTLFRNGIFEDVIKLRSYLVRGGPI